MRGFLARIFSETPHRSNPRRTNHLFGRPAYALIARTRFQPGRFFCAYAVCCWFLLARISRSAVSQSSFSWPGVLPRSRYSSYACSRIFTSRSDEELFAGDFRTRVAEPASGMVRTCLLAGVVREVFALAIVDAPWD